MRKQMVKPRIGAQEREVVGCLGGIQPNHFSALFEWTTLKVFVRKYGLAKWHWKDARFYGGEKIHLDSIAMLKKKIDTIYFWVCKYLYLMTKMTTVAVCKEGRVLGERHLASHAIYFWIIWILPGMSSHIIWVIFLKKVSKVTTAHFNDFFKDSIEFSFLAINSSQWCLPKVVPIATWADLGHCWIF